MTVSIVRMEKLRRRAQVLHAAIATFMRIPKDSRSLSTRDVPASEAAGLRKAVPGRAVGLPAKGSAGHCSALTKLAFQVWSGQDVSIET